MKVLLDGAAYFTGTLIMACKNRSLTLPEIIIIEQTIAKGIEKVLSEEFDKQLEITAVIISNVRGSRD